MIDQKLIYLVAGARPNFMKIAPVIRSLKANQSTFTYRLIHTGQHYDHDMSTVFFKELGIPEPDYHLECGGGSHSEQTAKIMIAFEKICEATRPYCVIVVGDVNSTLACSIVAKKLHIPVAHIEAGLRSGDRSMPEEINRLVTDSISDWFFCTEPAGVKNLLAEGKSPNSIFHVGHVMVDNLFYQLDQLAHENTSQFQSTHIKQRLTRYAVLTLHRPSNVDNPSILEQIFNGLNKIAEHIPLVFPVHPRTRSNLDKFGIKINEQIHITGPLSYMDFLNLWKDSLFVLTDSGGLQEESTAMRIPCLTLRHNTERPITVEEGTNSLVGTKPDVIYNAAHRILSGNCKAGQRPSLWDGNAADRIISHLTTCLNEVTS